MWRKMSSRWTAFKWMYVLFWRIRNWCRLRKWLTEDKHLPQKTKPYLFSQLCTFSIFPGELVPCIWAAVVPMLSSVNAFFKWQPAVFMKPLLRLSTDYNPVEKCGHPPSATHTQRKINLSIRLRQHTMKGNVLVLAALTCKLSCIC